MNLHQKKFYNHIIHEVNWKKSNPKQAYYVYGETCLIEQVIQSVAKTLNTGICNGLSKPGNERIFCYFVYKHNHSLDDIFKTLSLALKKDILVFIISEYSPLKTYESMAHTYYTDYQYLKSHSHIVELRYTRFKRFS